MKRKDMFEFTFESLDNTDKIIATTNLNQRLAIIDAPETIRAVLEFVKGHKEGWEEPQGGAPIARIRLNFYQGDRILGNVGIGKTFLSAHQYGGFYSKSSDESERAKLLDIMGLEKYKNSK